MNDYDPTTPRKTSPISPLRTPCQDFPMMEVQATPPERRHPRPRLSRIGRHRYPTPITPRRHRYGACWPRESGCGSLPSRSSSVWPSDSLSA